MSDQAGLKSKYETNSTRAEWMARLILVGLAVEIIEVLVLSRPFWEAFFTIGATALILIGVWGEIIFEKRAREAGDGMVADANARAAEANARALEAQLALERFKAPRTINPEQQQKIGEALRPFAGTPFDFSVNPSPEPQALMRQIGAILEEAGWQWVPFPDITIGMGEGNRRARVLISSRKLGLEISIARDPEWRDALSTLAKALAAAALEPRANVATDGSAPDNAIHIYIGTKE